VHLGRIQKLISSVLSKRKLKAKLPQV